MDCTGLKTIKLPENLTEPVIAFTRCTTLELISLSKNLERMNFNAFKGCSNLKKISVSIENTQYSSINGSLLNKNQHQLILCPVGNKDPAYTIVLPGSVVEISDWAFYGASDVTQENFPANLIIIGKN